MLMERKKFLEEIYQSLRYEVTQEDEKDREDYFLKRIKEWSLDESEEDSLKKEIFSYGPLDEFLKDDTISEVMINGYKNIWIDKKGELSKSSKSFLNEKSLYDCVQRLLSKVGRKIDWNTPYVDARLDTSCRVCAVIPPAVLDGLHLCIRKFSPKFHFLDFLLETGTISEKGFLYLKRSIREKKNILISGATGSGKTTLLNACINEVPKTERLLVLEDVAELQLEHPHAVRMESRPANMEGQGSISIRELLRVALRMRPDRLVIGECRGEEALDLLQALNTGHGGSFSSVHANSSREAINRLELLCLLAQSSCAPTVFRNYISSCVHIIIHMKREGEKRYVESIHEIAGKEGNTLLFRHISI